jgi:hypothetical protein
MAQTKCSSTTFDVTLSDAKLRNVFEATLASISADSHYALYNYLYPTAPTPAQIGLEIFDISGGKLNTVASLPSSDGSFRGLNAAANLSFSQLVLYDESVNTVGPNDLTTVRLRLGSFNGSTITISNASRTFPFIPSVLIDGGSYGALYTSDGQYIVFWFLGPRFNLNFALLSATDLSVVIPAQVVVAAQPTKAPVTNGPSTFRLCNNAGTATNYLALANGFGKSSPGSPVVNSNEPPGTLTIFRIDVNAKTFVAVDHADQAQYPNSALAFNPVNCCLQSTNIVVSERAAYLPGEPKIFTDVTKTSSFNGQTENVRVYTFDGTRLTQIAGHAFDTTMLASFWYPNGQIFGLATSSGSQNNVPDAIPQTNNFYQLCRNRGCHAGSSLESINFSITVPPESFFSQFTPNGQYFLVGGSPVFGPDGVTPAMNDIAIYRIDTNLPAFQCPSNNNNKNNCRKKC